MVSRVIWLGTRLEAVAWMLVDHPASGLGLLAAELAARGVPAARSTLWLATLGAGQTHPRPGGDRTVAGRAERAVGVVHHQEIRSVWVDVLHVRIVAAPALDISVDQPHRPGWIGGRRRGGGQGLTKPWSYSHCQDTAREV